jgi:UDP-glucose:(heptosyl)LPS alpha-1,3-glucosyltransferase
MLTPKKVVLLKAGSKQPGGLEKYTQRIGSAFVERGAHVTHLSTGLKGNCPPGIHFHPFPIKSRLSFRKIEQFDLAVQKWLKNHPADLIFGLDRNRIQTHLRAGNGVHAAFLKSRILTEGRAKYYLSLANPLHRKILSIEKESYSHPMLQKIFANSHKVRRELEEHYSVDPAKIEVIHNGIEWNEMEKDFVVWPEAKKSLLEKHQLDPHLFHLVFIGHGYLRKGLDALLEALAEWTFSDFHLSIIGKEKRMLSYIAKVKKLNKAHQIRFFGPQKTTLPFYQLADALIIPSFYDPFANVTIEALAMGLFVISSKENGGHEILTAQNGTVIENLLDPSSILQSLNLALQHRKTPQSSLSIRQTVRHLDFSHQLTRLIDACG